MCGICGIYNSQIKHIPRTDIMNMCDTMRHRGPDEFGYWSDDGIVLGHRRLSIIDLKTGQQPMRNEDGTIALVVNGEIYNYRELQELLIKKGHRFNSISDSEVIIHLYEEYGHACLSHVRGMFAFALWDNKKKELFCARDRMGQKPFFYACIQKKGNVEFVFASELEALCRSSYQLKEINERALYYYLTYGYVPHPFSIYKNVAKLAPAHYAIISDTGVITKRYWSAEDSTITIPRDEGKTCRVLHELVREATQLRMISDVPLGAFLSGGLDSSIVVGLMASLSAKPVKTFSIGFEDSRYNEIGYARMVAQKHRTEHTEFLVTPAMTDILPGLVKKIGEPFADSSCIPTYYVAQKTREQVTVALNGDGADESFAGYERYYAVKLSELFAGMVNRLPQGVWEKVCGLVPGRDDQRTFSFRLRRFLDGLGLPIAERYKRWMGSVTDYDAERLLGEPFRTIWDNERQADVVTALFAMAGTTDLVNTLLSVDRGSYLPGDLLVKMDSATMTHSLEARSPFLDHRVVEFAAKLNSAMKLRGKTGKYILRHAFRKYIPREVLCRKKMGFGVPVADWLRNELHDMFYDRVFSATSFTTQFFKKTYVREMMDMHCKRQWNYDRSLWAIFMLEMWYAHCYRGSN